METLLNKPVAWNNRATSTSLHSNHLNKADAFFKKQSHNVTGWFLVSLIFQGVFFLPVPVILSYYFGAPVYLLVITLGLFFANIIAGMASSGIRIIVYLLAASIAIHVLLVLFYLL